MKNYNNENVIVSLTSYGIRLVYVSKVIFSILQGTYKDVHIVLTIAKDDEKNIPNDLKLLIDNNIIEILYETDLGPHTKYFYAMKKYKNVPIITIDDDGIYDPNLVKSLMTSYEKHKNVINARRVHRIIFDKDKNIYPYQKWIFDYNSLETESMQLLATGVGGILYPPDILSISDDNLEEIKKCFYADDIYLKVLEIRKNIPVIWVKNNQLQPKKFNKEIEKIIKKDGLWKINTLKNRNDEYISLFKDDFKKCKIMM